MNELALFTGIGGGILGTKLLGWRVVCAVEISGFCQEILLQRQDDGYLDLFPVWDEIRSFDGRPWRGCVDIVTGGFPCQDISLAGKGAGLDGERSGLWSEFARIIGEVRPSYVLVENSPALLGRGLDRILGDLAGMGFDAEWGCIPAASVGAPHLRNRVWVAADATGKGLEKRQGISGDLEQEFSAIKRGIGGGCWWERELSASRVCGVDDGIANRMDRVKATGNAQVPSVVATAWRLLSSDELRTPLPHEVAGDGAA